jgi:meiotically up-regulated gene 157 (Mug157) protein
MGTMASYPDQRPAPERRAFSSPAVERCLVETAARIADPEVAWLFSNCFPNTLDTTVRAGTQDGRPDTFVITGDIPAMWLRDSTAQVWPYLPLAKEDPALGSLLAGVVNRQVECVLLDPYANAFEPDPAKESKWKSDLTEMKPGIHERKYELDSLCAVLRLSRGYYDATGDGSCFGGRWLEAVGAILDTIEREQHLAPEGEKPFYTFARVGHLGSDTLPVRSNTYPGKNCGLSRCAFRPSDDSMVLPFLIPANAMAVVELRHAARLLDRAAGRPGLAVRARALAEAIDAGIRRHGIVDHPECGKIFAYEVDGFGSSYFMDDANVPSLLSFPYLGYCEASDALYLNTRKAVLSGHNPFYSEGQAARGIGGPHVGPGHIWPMSIIIQALTSESEEEVGQCLRLLKATHGGTGWMHEAFWKDDPGRFTRKWFAWANTLFGELILYIGRKWPALLDRIY